MSRLRCVPLDMTGERNSSFFVLHSSLNPAPLDKTEKTIPATATPCHPERSAAKSKDLPKGTEILNKMSRLRCAPLDMTGERNSSFFVLHSSLNPAPLDRTEKTIPATATSCHPERSAAKSKDPTKGTEKLSKMSRLRCAPLDKTEKRILITSTYCHPERSAAKSKDLPKDTKSLNKMSRLRCAPLDRTGRRDSSFFVLHSSFNRPSSRPPDERCGRSSAPSPHRA